MGLPRKEQDPTRAERKAKKRKLEDAIPDLPGDNEIAEDSKVGEKSNKKRKVKEGSENIAGKERDSASLNQKGKKIKDKELSKESSTKVEINSANSTTKKKKETLASDVAHSDNAVEFMEPHTPVADDQTPRKSKKERKAARKVAEAAEAAKVISNRVTESVKVGTEPAAVMEVDQVKKAKKNNRNREKKRKGANGTTLGASDADAGEKKEGKAARFIVFIGNLPFSATTESIQRHFAAVKPKSVRHLTKKEDPTKSKGCAFVEFDGYDHMKTCLKQLHHSTFDDGVSAPRKINVELTAGGGGKTKNRQAKIGEKNQKLNEERIRRIQEEEKAKLIKREAAIDHDSVHPSRRARVPDTA